jgi:hypothetical protein
MSAASIPMPERDPWKDRRRRTEIGMIITPEIAKRILAQNDPNRPTGRHKVAMFVRDIRGGKWDHNGETICMSVSGRLLDGRHRFTAIVIAGLPIVSDVAFGVPDESFWSFGQGRSRSAADVLKMEGKTNPGWLRAAVALLMAERVEGLGPSMFSKGGFFTTYEIVAAVDEFPGVEECVRAICGPYRFVSDIITPRCAAWALYRFSEQDPEATGRFFYGLATGDNLSMSSPVLILRNRLSKNKMSKSKLPPSELLALTIKAFNHFRTGRPCRYLAWRSDGPGGEAYPQIE